MAHNHGADREVLLRNIGLKQNTPNVKTATLDIQWRFDYPCANHRDGVRETLTRWVRRIMLSSGRYKVRHLSSDFDLLALSCSVCLWNINLRGLYSHGWKEANYLIRDYWIKTLQEYTPTLKTNGKKGVH